MRKGLPRSGAAGSSLPQSGAGNQPRASRGRPSQRAADPSFPRLWADAIHDLRQPLQGALLLSRVLEADVRAAGQKQSAHHLATALESVAAMFEALVVLSRIEAGLHLASPADCELGEVVEAAARELAPLAAERGVPLQIGRIAGRLRSHPPLLAIAVRSLLLQGLRLGTPEGIGVAARRRGARVHLEVAVAGAVLDAAREGDAFVQLPSRTAGSLGFGLPLLRHLCRHLGHGLEARTKRDGSGVVLSLDLAVAPAPA